MKEHPLQLQSESAGNNEQQARLHKLKLAKTIFGFNYPNDFRRSHQADQIQQLYETWSSEQLTQVSEIFLVCGRIRALRRMGKLTFIKLEDHSGAIQILLSYAHLGEQLFEDWNQVLDLGDLIGVSGSICRTQRGELSIQASKVELLTKTLRPLAEKYHGLTDPEMRQRKRYLELASDGKQRERFILRSKIIQAVRDYLFQQEFLEVETPMMHPIPGGAAAKPFITQHHSLHQALYLRIAPELYLKRLVVGGFEKVFELNRNFRNEGISPRHNPEFTMLEFYQAYVGYEEMMQHLQALLRFVVEKVFGVTQLTLANRSIDFTKPFTRLSLVQALSAYAPSVPEPQWSNKAHLERLCQEHAIPVQENWEVGSYQFALFESLVEPTLMQPTFIVGYPASISPLARRRDDNSEEVERFELFVAGRELANGFSELNDPYVQAQAFHRQEESKAAGDDEAMHFDADYIEALECGLAPTGGVGVGIDRLVMWLTESENIRDIILFPTLKRKQD